MDSNGFNLSNYTVSVATDDDYEQYETSEVVESTDETTQEETETNDEDKSNIVRRRASQYGGTAPQYEKRRVSFADELSSSGEIKKFGEQFEKETKSEEPVVVAAELEAKEEIVTMSKPEETEETTHDQPYSPTATESISFTISQPIYPTLEADINSEEKIAITENEATPEEANAKENDSTVDTVQEQQITSEPVLTIESETKNDETTAGSDGSFEVVETEECNLTDDNVVTLASEPIDICPKVNSGISWGKWLFTHLFDQVTNNPGKIALIEEVCESRSVTFAELLDNVMKVANYLSHHGIECDSRVGICMENCVEFVYYQLAVFVLGAVPILLNPGHVVGDKISELEVKTIVVDSDHYGHILRTFDKWKNLQQLFVLAEDLTSIFIPRNVWALDGFGYLDFSSEFHKKMEKEDGLVVAFATSGTSNSKGKIVAHESMSAQLLCTSYYAPLFTNLQEKDPEFNPDEATHLITNGLHSIDGWSYLMYSLITGGTAVISETSADVWRVSFMDRVAGLVEQFRAPLVFAHSQFLNTLVKYEVNKVFDLSSLKVICHSGSPIPSATAKKITEDMKISVIQAYSTTEFGVVAYEEVHQFDTDVVSCGQLFEGVELKITKLSDETEVEANVMGRIFIRGNNVFKTYLCKSDKTNFTADRWYKTDDCGLLDESGRLFVAGPIESIYSVDDKIISLSMAENVLLSHVAVEDIAICILNGSLCAGVVFKEGEMPPATDELNNLLTEKNINIELTKVVFVDFIPRTETGKIARSEIPFLLSTEAALHDNETSI